jgi:hypothetical protein
MKALLGMVVYRGSQVFKIPTRTTIATSELGVGSAIHTRYFGQHLPAPPFGEPQQSFVKLRFVRLTFTAIFVVHRQHVGHID